MTTEWKVRALRAARESGLVHEYETSEAAGPFEWDSAMRVANLASIRQDDPTASYLEELLVRLDGPNVHSAGFRTEWSQLLTLVQETISTLSEEDLTLELCDVSSGSAVVHLRPTAQTPDTAEAAALPVPNDDTGFSKAASRFLDLVSQVSENRPMAPWKTSVRPFMKFAENLNRFGLSAGFTSRSATGSMSRAILTRSGMEYLSKLQEVKPIDDEMVVSGRVVEMRSSGHVKVKTGANRNAPAYDVQMDPEVIHNLRPYLGDTVHWVVKVVAQEDGLGERKSVEYQFLGLPET